MRAYLEKNYKSDDGLNLYYREYGVANTETTPILCLPGLTRNSRDFHELALHLSKTRRILCADLRGRGFSDYDPDYKNYHPGTYLGDIIKLLDHEAIEQIIIVGTSLGGLIAMLIAATKPSLLKGVVLNDVGPEIDPDGLARIKEYVGLLPPVKNWDEALAQTKLAYEITLPGLSETDWLNLVKRGYREIDGQVRIDMDSKIGDAAREVGAALVDPWVIFEPMKNIPTLCLRGELSDILSVEIFDKMKRRKPDLIRVTIPDRGHVPLLDEPQSLAAIDAFLEHFNDQ